ncbi:MAG TPA: Crp/Fnr family transcriptional regulator [Anaerolineales bacterium]|nr:Crp/Fnr family transcriptional regulator [Anaerolineales bacterium]
MAAEKSTPDKYQYLSSVDIFCDLAHQEIEKIGQRTAMRQVPAGTTIYTPEQTQEVLFILKKGRVRLYQLSPFGRRLTIGTLEEGTIFGQMALLGQVLQQKFAEAITPCLLCVMSREDVKSVLLSDPRIAVRITEIMGKRLIEAEERLLEFAFMHAPARIAAQLLRMAEPRRGWLGKGQPVLNCTHSELAELVGMHRETVTKVLNEFRDKNLVKLGRGKVVLTDLAGLEELEADRT